MSEVRPPEGQRVESDPRQARKIWRAYEQSSLQQGDGAELAIGLSATFTVDTLVPMLGAHLLERGLKPAFAVGPYNQIFQLCHDPASAFGRECDVIVVLWRIEDLMLQEIEAYLTGDRAAIDSAQRKIRSLTGALADLRRNFSGMIVVSVPPFPVGLAGAGSLHGVHDMEAFYRLVATQFGEQANGIDGVHLFEMEAVQRRVGIERSFDARNWYLYRIPYSEPFFHQVGKVLARMVVASRRAPRKCVVLDCDNTIWGGIIGEDGLEGIQIGDEFPGSAFRDFQKLLLNWRDQGILLAICSKNNEADALEVFEKHRGMILRLDHLTARRIDWRSKPENLVEIARELNIGVDSLVFIDDSKMEIDYVRSVLPEVSCILLPEDPADIMAAVSDLELFDKLEVSDEDRKRPEMMRAEIDRKALVDRVSPDDFLKTLQLRVDLFAARPEDLGRITQLINKTNQFNLSTRRRTLDQMRALLQSPDFRIFGLNVFDRFGEYGLTGVVVVEQRNEGQTWFIDTLLLSCRVLGRGVESALVSLLAGNALESGAREFVACYVPTPKNGLAATYLTDHGFVRTDHDDFRLDLTGAGSASGPAARLPADG